jgi:hypothetical protein
MQIIALSGYSVDESTVRVPVASLAEAVSTSDAFSQIAATLVKDDTPPGNPAFLKTCALRC